MNDPARQCENGTGNGTRLLGTPGVKRKPHFFGADFKRRRPREYEFFQGRRT
jgi:hypothetical protein